MRWSAMGAGARLAARNLRHRPGQALLLLVTLTIATGVLGVAMSLYGSADAAWDRVWRATGGFDVGVGVYHGPDQPGDRALVAELRRRAVQLARAPGVAEVSGPSNSLSGSIRIRGGTEDLSAEVVDPNTADTPLVTSGRWLGDGGGIVLESGLAAAVGASPGDTVTIQGRPFPVRGVAMTAAGRYPLYRPAQIWVTPQTAAAMRDLGMREDGFALAIRLVDPNQAEAFIATHQEFEVSDPSSSVTSFLETAQQRRAASHSDLDGMTDTLFAAGILIAILTVATASVLVAGRMAARIRQVGTLKAVGVTPRQVALVLLVEHLAIAVVATTIGLGIGRLLAPAIAGTSVSLLGRPEPPPLTWSRIGAVAAVAFAVVLLGTVRPALRGIRQSTLRSLDAGPRPPRRPGRLAGLAARAGVPVPGVLGLRSAWRRPGRLLTNATGLALGVAVIVVALGLRESLDLLQLRPTEPGQATADAAVAALYDQIRGIIFATGGLLLLLAAINAWIVATLAARDAARNQAVMRAVGATPRQTVTSLVVSQLVACAIAVVAGIPLGLGLWSVIDGGDLPPVRVPATSLVLLAAAVPIAFAALVSVPARLLARRPIAPLLTYE